MLPAKPATALLLPALSLPDDVDESMLQKLMPTTTPTMSLLPVPVMLPLAVDCSCLSLPPHSPDNALSFGAACAIQI